MSLFLLASCSNESDINQKELDSKDNIYIPELGMELVKKGDVLVFQNTEEFNLTVEKLRSAEVSLREGNGTGIYVSNDISFKQYGFNSIFDDFVSAMNEAEEYYEKENGYESFKEKYNNLYFPEYKNDYSAYLPVSDNDVAKLLNQKGEVMIGEEIVSFIDIDSYDQLRKLGLGWSEDDLVSEATRADELTINEYPKGGQNGTWNKRGRRRLKIRCYTKTRTGDHGVAEEIVIDVAFRRKNGLGIWYNYSSETILGAQGSTTQIKKSGFSSHDYTIARKFNGGPVRYQVLHWLKYKDFSENVQFMVNL